MGNTINNKYGGGTCRKWQSNEVANTMLTRPEVIIKWKTGIQPTLCITNKHHLRRITSVAECHFNTHNVNNTPLHSRTLYITYVSNKYINHKYMYYEPSLHVHNSSVKTYFYISEFLKQLRFQIQTCHELIEYIYEIIKSTPILINNNSLHVTCRYW